MELADMRDLGSRAAMRWGSSPHARTSVVADFVSFATTFSFLKQRSSRIHSVAPPLEHIRASRDMIFYLAFYIYLDTPFFIAIQKQPALLF